MDRIRSFGRLTFSSFAIRNYRLFFAGQAISLSGTWMQTVAQGWLVLLLTGSGTQLGIVVALQFLPVLLFGPWGGLLSDRYDKLIILYITNAVSGVMSLLLSVLVFTHQVELWHLYALAIIFGLIRVFDNPARQTFVSELVGDEHLKNAISLNATVNNLARAVGPSIGGILIASVGIAFCFFFNALSFIAVIVTQLMMRRSELHPTKRRSLTAHAVREGFEYVKKTPIIFDLLVMMALIGTFVYEFQVSLPILAQQTFQGDAASYALLMSALGVGSVFGGLFAAGLRSMSTRLLLLFITLCGVSLLVASLMPTLQLAVIAMLPVGFFTINVTSLANTMLQLRSDPAMRGRVMSLWSMAMMGSTPIGGPIVGFIGEFVGGRWGLAIGGVSALVAAAYGAFFLLRKNHIEVVSEFAQLAAQEAVAELARKV